MFKSADAAYNAYEELRRILFSVDRWHRERPEESKHWGGNLVPPEEAVVQQYNVEWPVSIDWDMGWASYWSGKEDTAGQVRKLIDEAVIVVGKTVFMSPPAQTWMRVQPFQGLLEHFGATTWGYDHETFPPPREIENWIAFTAPDYETAERIDMTITAYLEGPELSDENPPPWQGDASSFESTLARNSMLRRDAIENLKALWQDNYELQRSVTSKPESVDRMRRKRVALARGTLHRDDRHFRLVDFSFYYLEHGLAALIAYLEVNGCSDIDMHFAWKSEVSEDN